MYTWHVGGGYKQQFISFDDKDDDDDDDTREREREMPVHALWIITTLSWLHYTKYITLYTESFSQTITGKFKIYRFHKVVSEEFVVVAIVYIYDDDYYYYGICQCYAASYC